MRLRASLKASPPIVVMDEGKVKDGRAEAWNVPYGRRVSPLAIVAACKDSVPANT